MKDMTFIKIPIKNIDQNNPYIKEYTESVKRGFATIHVRPVTKGWTVNMLSSKEVPKLVSTKTEAIRIGHDMAKKTGGQLIVHEK